MKSLNSSTAEGCPLDNNFFTTEALNHILSEKFEWRNNNDSYAERRNLKNFGCYHKYEDGNGVDIHIFICEDGIEVDQDYDCGGNMNSVFFKFEYSFEEAYDKMVNHVNSIKNR